MRLKSNFLLLILVFLYCSSEPKVDISQPQNVLTDVLTLELSFGADEKNLDEEFLLASPWAFDVSTQGHIFVSDEYKIKVYDSNGKEKTIIGGLGQGPGEFKSHVLVPILSYTGYLTVTDEFRAFNVFSSEFKFIKRVSVFSDKKYSTYFRKDKLTPASMISDVYSIDEKRRIFNLETKEIDGTFLKGNIFLVYEDSDTLINIAQIQKNKYSGKKMPGYYIVPYHDNLEWETMPDNVLVYTVSTYSKKSYTKNPTYTLNVLSLDTIEQKQISFSYNPVRFPDSTKSKRLELEEETGAPKSVTNHVKDIQYYPPIRRLLADMNFLFVYSYYRNENGEYLVEILDMKKEERINYAYFPILFTVIKNGYGYRKAKDPEGFAIIEKYKINPAVYGKHH